VRFTAAEFEQYLRDSTNYSEEDISNIVDTYLIRTNAIYYHGDRTVVNHVFSYDSDISSEIKEKLLELHKKHGNESWMCQLSFGKLLYSQKDSAAKFYHPSWHGDSAFLKEPVTIKSSKDIDKVVDTLKECDLNADLSAPRENSSYKGVTYTNVEIMNTPRVVYDSRRKKVLSVRNCCVNFPHYKRVDRTIVSHFSNSLADFHIDDGLCLFRALVLFRRGARRGDALRIDEEFQDEVESLVLEYAEFRQKLIEDEIQLSIDVDLERDDVELNGIPLNEIPLIEECFSLNIVILQKDETGRSQLLRDSCFRHGESKSSILYLDQYEDHVSYIPNI